MVKAMFNHARFRDELRLSGVNSINWARVAAQVGLLFHRRRRASARRDRPVSFSVPTGNFGDILAGWVAKRMGLPIERLMIGTNANDILVARARHRLLRDQGRAAHRRHPRWTSRSRRISSASCSRPTAATPALFAHAHGRPCRNRAPSRSTPSPGAHPRGVRGAAAVDEADGRRGDGGRPTAAPAMCSIRIRRSAPGPAARLLRTSPRVPVVALATAHPAKFPGRGRAGHGRAPGPAAATWPT